MPKVAVHSIPMVPGESYLDMIRRWSTTAPRDALPMICIDMIRPPKVSRTVYI